MSFGESISWGAARLLSRWGVDAQQYHHLLRASLKIDFRSPAKVRGTASSETKSALKATMVMNLIFTMIMSESLLMTHPQTSIFSMVLLGYSMVMVAMSILIEFGLVVISPDDFLILAHRPISSRTFFAVKISNLLFYVTLLSLSLTLVPSLLGLACTNSRSYFTPLYLLIATLASFFVTGVIVALYGVLLRRVNYERFKDLLVYCQVAFSFVFFFGYQILPFLAGSIATASLINLAHTWGVIFPSLWFAALLEICLGHFSSEATMLAGAALIGVIVVIPILLRSVSLDYSDQIGRIIATPAKTVQKPRVFARPGLFIRLLNSLAPDPEERAFLGFFLVMLRRNRQLKLQLYPNFGIVIAMVAFLFIQSRKLGDPFEEQAFGSAVTIPIMAFLFTTVGITTQLPFSDEFAGSWIFSVAPVQQRKHILKAIKKAVVLVFFLPLFLLNAALFGFFWPISHAIAHSVYALSVGLLALQILLFFFRDFPFSRKLEKGVKGRGLVAAFMSIFLIVGFTLVPHLFRFGFRWYIAAVAVLAATGLFLGHLNNRAYAARLRFPEG